MTRMTLSNPNFARLESHIRYSATLGLKLVDKGRHADAPGFIVCGTAPSLTSAASLRKIRQLVAKGYIVIALKEALTLLSERGIPIRYSVAMDPDAKQIAKTPIVPGVTYCIASSCSPALFDYLKGAGADIEIFHSACGVTDECELYVELFGKGDVVIGGYTLGNRATGLAVYMSGEKPKVYCAGIMFGTRKKQEGDSRNGYYAKGVMGVPGNSGPWFCDDGKVDGKVWWTKLDLMASAIDMARKIKQGVVEMIGDSLAASLSKHPDEFLQRVCKKETLPLVRPTPLTVSPVGLVRTMLYQMGEELPRLAQERAAA